MINNQEIEAKSAELGVHIANVQRDYVFGWILAGLYQPSNPLAADLILKGGNAFRKAYFEHARYSNDLDFSTIVEVEEEELRAALEASCAFATAKSGVEIGVRETRVDSRVVAGEDGLLYEARLYFKSFYGEDDVVLRVDLDVKEYDRVILPVQERNLVHAYSDAVACSAILKVQKLEELLAAKLLALLGRQHSPDLYDFIHSIFIQKVLNVRRREIITTFLKKSIYEPTPTVARELLLDLPFALLRGLWDEFLVCPTSSRIAFEDAERAFRTIIPDLFALLAPAPAYVVAGSSGGPTYFTGGFRNSIIEAGRLQRVMRIVYDGYARFVEPYAIAFKRRKDGIGQEYFYAWDRSGGQSGTVGIKSFFPDKISSAQMTEEVFEPRFPIEMAKGGVGYFSSGSFASVRRSAPRASSYGVLHAVQCSYCGKRFRRKTRNTRLNPHKDKYGNRCLGRIGYLIS